MPSAGGPAGALGERRGLWRADRTQGEVADEAAIHSGAEEIPLLPRPAPTWCSVHPCRRLALATLVAGGALAVCARFFDQSAGHAQGGPRAAQLMLQAESCETVQEGVDFATQAELDPIADVTSLEDCRRKCEEIPDCGAWTWGRAREVEDLSDMCWPKVATNRAFDEIANVNVVSGFPCREDSKAENHYFYDPAVGHWGGICTCPDGQHYEVGDYNHACTSLACEGGTAGQCSDGGISTSNAGMKVVCAQEVPHKKATRHAKAKDTPAPAPSGGTSTTRTATSSKQAMQAAGYQGASTTGAPSSAPSSAAGGPTTTKTGTTTTTTSSSRQAGTTKTTSTSSRQACSDTDVGATDQAEDLCNAGEYPYNSYPSYCGYYDDTDFTSTIMCCVCGGGSDPTQALGDNAALDTPREGAEKLEPTPAPVEADIPEEHSATTAEQTLPESTTTVVPTPLPTMTTPTTRPEDSLSLYCFALYIPRSYEQQLLAWQVEQRVSLFACDEAAVYSNESQQLGPGVETIIVNTRLQCDFGGEFGTALNLDIFLVIWDAVFDDGAYLRHNWTLKVDPDCVFFPDRLRATLLPHTEAGQTGAGVYINNCPFGLHGPLEVFSTAAVTTWHEGRQQCIDHFNELCSGPCYWGEDMFIDQCLMNVLNSQRVDDFGQLVEDHCNPPEGWENCTDGFTAAFHPFKTTDSYKTCLESARAAAQQPATTSGPPAPLAEGEGDPVPSDDPLIVRG